jgi:hypothetical protein
MKIIEFKNKVICLLYPEFNLYSVPFFLFCVLFFKKNASIIFSICKFAQEVTKTLW